MQLVGNEPLLMINSDISTAKKLTILWHSLKWGVRGVILAAIMVIIKAFFYDYPNVLITIPIIMIWLGIIYSIVTYSRKVKKKQ
jgi:hypothetical protein